MFEHIGTPLRGMTAETAFVCAQQRGSAADVNRALMGRMTDGASHFPLRQRMMTGEIKLAPDIQMTLEADGFR